MEKGSIYRIFNVINNKSYVGQSLIVEKRIKNHFRYAYKQNKTGKLYEDMRKYGEENFSHEILEEVYSENKIELMEKLELLEKYYIEKFDSYFEGYNGTRGGMCTKPIYLVKYEKTNVDRKKYGKGHGKTSVNQYDLEGNFLKTFESIHLAGKETKTSKGEISQCCRYLKPTANSFLWQYSDSVDLEKTFQRINNSILKPNKRKNK